MRENFTTKAAARPPLLYTCGSGLVSQSYSRRWNPGTGTDRLEFISKIVSLMVPLQTPEREKKFHMRSKNRLRDEEGMVREEKHAKIADLVKSSHIFSL